MDAVYKRIVIKLSGEVLAGTKKLGFDHEVIEQIARTIVKIHNMGVEVSVVVGAGNIWRGRQGGAANMKPVTADHMGMMGTLINALCLQDVIERLGVLVRVMSAVDIHSFAEPYIQRRAVRHLEKRRIVVFAAGTGNPMCSTDSAAALRAAEIEADCILKGTNVDALYDKDPNLYQDATPIHDITFQEAAARQMKVMDITAFTMCMEQNVPEIRIFNLNDPENMVRVVCGENIGTRVHQ